MTRMIPLLAVVAVAMCVALVIVVISVMTGFLDMVRASGKTLMGDVVISRPISGIPDYERLIDMLNASDSVAAATPVVDTWGLLRMPYPYDDAKELAQVQIWGIDPSSFSDVTRFDQTLQWNEVPKETAAIMRWQAIIDIEDDVVSAPEVAARIVKETDEGALDDASPEVTAQLVAGMHPRELRQRLRSLAWTPDRLKRVLGEDGWRALHANLPRLRGEINVKEEGKQLLRDGRPAMVSGIHVSKGNERTSEGTYAISGGGEWWMPRFEATLTTMPIDGAGGLAEPERIVLPFANEFSSGVYIIDQSRVMVPIDIVQDLTNLDAAETVDADGQVIGRVPAKATMILIRGIDGLPPQTLKTKVAQVYAAFEGTHNDASWTPPSMTRHGGPVVRTWEEQNASFIGPVEKERELMRTLFSIVYLVCGALIVAIFWAIVYEKTRDIGILRAIGATRMGIVWIFLLYGLFVGCIGALVGIGLGWLLMENMPFIHEGLANPPLWLGITLLVIAAILALWSVRAMCGGRLLPMLLGSLGAIVLGGLGVIELAVRASGGIVLWDPAVYYFTAVPDQVDWESAWITAAGAVICSVIAAAIPAAKAADIDPVGALRYE